MFIPELTTRITVKVNTDELDNALETVRSDPILGDIPSLASDLEERKAKLQGLQEPLADAIAKTLSSIQENIISSKHYKTGMMSNSVDISTDGNDRLVGNTASSATGFPYPLAIEKGTKEHDIPVFPVEAKALHWVQDGEDRFSMGHIVHVSGITPDPFVQPSIDDTMYLIETLFKDL